MDPKQLGYEFWEKQRQRKERKLKIQRVIVVVVGLISAVVISLTISHFFQ